MNRVNNNRDNPINVQITEIKQEVLKRGFTSFALSSFAGLIVNLIIDVIMMVIEYRKLKADIKVINELSAEES